MTSTQEIADRHDSRSCGYSSFRPWDEGNSRRFPFAESSDLSDGTPADWITNSYAEEQRRISFDVQGQEKTRQEGYSDNRYPTRVCSDCNTTKTPLWRSGPQGPKSLCNACGIRLRKARRAKAAALNAGLIPAVEPSKVRKEKTSASQRAVPFKKRCKLAPDRAGGGLVFEDFGVGSAYHRLFPQDEKEAALLLMALSSGLIRG